MLFSSILPSLCNIRQFTVWYQSCEVKGNLQYNLNTPTTQGPHRNLRKSNIRYSKVQYHILKDEYVKFLGANGLPWYKAENLPHSEKRKTVKRVA